MSQVSLVALSCTTRRSVSIARFLRLWRNGWFARPRQVAYAAAMASTEAPPAGRHEAAQSRPAQPPAFPGCKPVHLPRTEIDRFEGRLDRSLHYVGERNGEHHRGGFRLRSLRLEVNIRNPSLAYRTLGVPGAVQRQRRLPGHRPRVGVEVGEELARPCLLGRSEITPVPQEVVLGMLGVLNRRRACAQLMPSLFITSSPGTRLAVSAASC